MQGKMKNFFPKNRLDWIRLTGVLAAVGLALLGTPGCGDAPQAAPQAPPPMPVTVAHPLQKEVVEWDTYTGHLEAPESVNVVARVSGLVMETPFVEGAIVKKGD